MTAPNDYADRHPLPVRDRRAVDAVRAMLDGAAADESCFAVAARAYVIAREHGLSRARATSIARRAADHHRRADR